MGNAHPFIQTPPRKHIIRAIGGSALWFGSPQNQELPVYADCAQGLFAEFLDLFGDIAFLEGIAHVILDAFFRLGLGLDQTSLLVSDLLVDRIDAFLDGRLLCPLHRICRSPAGKCRKNFFESMQPNA